jgi:16S rRNA (guanine527-N7)-methyltransferase
VSSPQPAPLAPPQHPPAQAEQVFGPGFDAARRYAELLCTQGVVRGLLGPREPLRIWTRHLLNSLALAPFIPADAVVVDLGSGAGLPGIPIALVRPDLRMTLLEPLARRMRFLEEVRDLLDLDVTLVRARAEDASLLEADVVVARAVAPLGRLIELAVPLLRPGGVLLAQKGAGAAEEVAGAAQACARLGVADVSVLAPVADGDSAEQTDAGTCVVRVVTGTRGLPLARTARRRRGVR